MKKGILIIGSTGMLGSALNKYFTENNYVINTLNRNDLDLSTCTYEELEYQLQYKTVNIDLIVNCAGLIKQRQNTTPEEFLKVNGLIPQWIDQICIKFNKKFIHVTTDCVYDGTKGNYSELDPKTATDVYGLSKVFGESLLSTVIRTSIIGDELHNKLSLVEWVKSNKGGEINGYDNHFWNGVTCLQLSKIIHQINEKNIFWMGVRHIFSNSVSKFELVNYINQAYELNIVINKSRTDVAVDRTLTTIYGNIPFDIPSIEQQILEMSTWN